MITHHFIPTQDHHRLAIITFDKEKSLNAQDLTMVKAIQALLTDWQNKTEIVAIIMRGAGEKAFCAGGDIKGLYHAISNNTAQVYEFFEHEYALMHQIHTYPKPIIAWGNGIVMGGGLGLLAGASHKLVSQSTLMAMPEVSIGLFPDAGGTYFLSRMMGKVGLFLGLTGARFNGADAYHLGLADFVIDKHQYQAILDDLSAGDWSNKDHQGLVNQILNTHHNPALTKDSPILDNLAAIHGLMNAGDLSNIDKALVDYQGDSALIQSAQAFYVAGSPTTKALTYALYHRAKTLSLKQVLTLELHTAIHCCLIGDFKEGVRALLIDKDKNPRWQYALDEINDEMVSRYFQSPYGECHPFDAL